MTVSPSSPAPLPPPPAPPSEPVVPQRARRRGTGAIVTLTLLLLAAIGVGGYLWLTTVRWQDDSTAWEAKARGYAQEVAELRSELEGVNAELVAAREQLATATERITDLANEKAQLGDENVASQQYLDYQRRVTEAAGVVATALGQCTQAQSQLIEYLEDAEAYDPADLDRFATEVSELCRQANEANDQLQQELSQ